MEHRTYHRGMDTRHTGHQRCARGRFLQEDPIEGGSANAYAYTSATHSTPLTQPSYTATVEG
jgi:hypothetical protein